MCRKYLLIVHGAGAFVVVCDTPEQREVETRLAINGGTEAPCPELEVLREHGVTLGGHPVQWITASVRTPTTDALLLETYTWLNDGPMDNGMRYVLHSKIGDCLGKPSVEYGE